MNKINKNLQKLKEITRQNSTKSLKKTKPRNAKTSEKFTLL